MVLHRPFFFALLCLPLPADDSFKLGLIAHFERAPPSAVMTELQAEMTRLLQLPGIRIEWRSPSTVRDGDRFDRVIVLRFSGCCRPLATPASPPCPAPLGLVRAVDSGFLPFADIACDRIMHEIARARRYPLLLSPVVYGRALARVTAHEIYHILSQSAFHDAQGLSKTHLDPEELCQPRFDFCPEALARMGEALSSAPPRALLTREAQ